MSWGGKGEGEVYLYEGRGQYGLLCLVWRWSFLRSRNPAFLLVIYSSHNMPLFFPPPPFPMECSWGTRLVEGKEERMVGKEYREITVMCQS